MESIVGSRSTVNGLNAHILDTSKVSKVRDEYYVGSAIEKDNLKRLKYEAIEEVKAKQEGE